MTTRMAKEGEGVLCDGQMHLITDTFKRYSKDLEALVLLVVFENANRRVTGVFADLRWDGELGNWYLWGRALAKPDRIIVAELRDRALLPARRTRTPGNAPAGGEHLNLYKSLFNGRPRGFWDAALAQVRPGGELPPEAVEAIEDYRVRFKQKLVDGYADVDADDSTEEN